MKTPRAIIVAITGYVLFIIWRIISFCGVLGCNHASHNCDCFSHTCISNGGYYRPSLEKKWSRKFTMALFMIILLMHLGSLDDHFKELNVFNLSWTLGMIALALYVFHQFYTEPDIQKYLKT